MTDLPATVDDSLIFATPHVRIDEQGVSFVGSLSIEEYMAWTHQILYVWNSVPFFIGDTLVYGEQFIGEEYTQVFEEHYSKQTLANYASVCRRVPQANRRIHELSFSHHEAVAALPAEEQAGWLQEAIDNGWHRDELRAAISGNLPPAVIMPRGNDPELEQILLDAFEANSTGDSIKVAELLDKAIMRVRGK